MRPRRPPSVTPLSVTGRSRAVRSREGSSPSSVPSALRSRRGLGPLAIAGLAVGTAGLVGLGVGAGFAAKAASKNTDSMADCDAANICGPAGKALRLEALAAADVATGLVVAGGALAATGATLFVIGLIKINDGNTGALRVAPVVGQGFVGVHLGGAF